MITPREKLIENIIDIVHATQSTRNDEKLARLVQLLLATLKTHYAIGRWVSVEERLPTEEWKGLCVYYGDEVVCQHYSAVKGWHTEEGIACRDPKVWLELDLPEVES